MMVAQAGWDTVRVEDPSGNRDRETLLSNLRSRKARRNRAGDAAWHPIPLPQIAYRENRHEACFARRLGLPAGWRPTPVVVFIRRVPADHKFSRPREPHRADDDFAFCLR